jgi:cytochrome c6
VIVALTTENRILLGGMAAIFIAFALSSAFLIPRYRPDFPGRGVGYFVIACAVLFGAMMLSVEYFAVEEEEAHGGTVTEVTTGTTETGAGGTTTEGTTTEATTTEGDPVSGKRIFAAQDCGACHTLADAGTNGTIGPNLDEAKPDLEIAIDRVTNGKPPMPAFKDQLSEQEIADVAAYVVEATSG